MSVSIPSASFLSLRRLDVRLAAALLAGSLCAGSAGAHDFWLQPDQYQAQPHASLPFTLQVGHGSERQRSQIRLNRIIRFQVVTPAGVSTDVRDTLQLRGATDDGRVYFQEAGTHLLVLETDSSARSTLPAQRFNKYAMHEGLTPALEQRQRKHQMDADASESFRRVSKAIVQLGATDAPANGYVTTPVGLPLEIVPERDPYAESRQDDFPVRVIFEGQPLAGALVKLTALENDAVPLQANRTDSAGRARFSLSKGATYLFSVVWTKPLEPSADVDFETTFSSLTLSSRVQ
jgi:uncharacterized GH25 family protein